MKEWQIHIVLASSLIILGMCSILLSQIIAPDGSEFNTSFWQNVGILIIGAGLGVFACTNPIYRLEKKTRMFGQKTTAVKEQLTPAEVQRKRICQFCGAENKLDAVFCEKCGKASS